MWIFEMVIVLMFGVMEIVMEWPPPTPRRSVDDYGFDFSLAGASGEAGFALSRSRKGLSPPLAPL
jgi:hypothetical protein